MQNKPGVYAYLMPLREEQTFQVGALGTFTFPAGWYVYAGSAQQGVQSRTKAHRNDTKEPRYNVDYLRKYAPISEIWFTYGGRSLECQFAQALLFGMTGTGFVAREFGSRDCRNCYTHLIYFEQRPFPAAFRAVFKRRVSTLMEVFVEFVTPAADDPVALNSEDVSPLLPAYDRGRRWIERQRLAVFQDESVETVADVAVELGVSLQTLKQDIQLAEAVDLIVANCGQEAFSVLFNPRRAQTRDSILKLSRTADTRQQHRIKGVLEGKMRSVRPQDDDYLHVYDTVSFAEIPSRLKRARGTLQVLQRSLSEPCPEPVAKEVRRLIELCRKAALQLRRFVNSKSSKEKSVPPALSKERVAPILRSREVEGPVVGFARGPLAFTIKSVWGFPEIERRGLFPTAQEREKTLAELKTIITTSEAILAMLDDEDSVSEVTDS